METKCGRAAGSAFIETWIKAVSKHRNFFIEELDNVPCNPDAIIGKSIANNLYAEKYDNIFSMNDKSCDCMKSGAGHSMFGSLEVVVNLFTL